MILGYPRPKAASLSISEWLEVATAGLTASAREKIGREISAHYLDAVEAHRAKGESEETARAAAFAELGDPAKAGVKFREQYLTEGDLACMRHAHATALRPWNNISVLVGIIVFCVIFVSDLSVTDGEKDPIVSFFTRHNEFRLALVFVAFLIACVLTPAMSYRLAKRSSVELAARTLLNREITRYVFISMTALLLSAYIMPIRNIVPLFSIFALQRIQNTLRKLRKRGKSESNEPRRA